MAMKVHQEQAQDFPLVIATVPATDRQRTMAVGVVIVFDLVTATLLFAQFSIQPQRALLALASGYIFSGSFAFLQTLAFPGGYAPAGLIGDGLNSPAWIYVLWHTSFPAAILFYSLSNDATRAARPGRPAVTAIAVT